MHKAAGVREVIEAAGAKLRYPPKYSPDLNPIEMAFSKLKAHLRKAAERTIPHLSRRIGALVAAFSPQARANTSDMQATLPRDGIRSKCQWRNYLPTRRLDRTFSSSRNSSRRPITFPNEDGDPSAAGMSSCSIVCFAPASAPPAC